MQPPAAVCRRRTLVDDVVKVLGRRGEVVGGGVDDVALAVGDKDAVDRAVLVHADVAKGVLVAGHLTAVVPALVQRGGGDDAAVAVHGHRRVLGEKRRGGQLQMEGAAVNADGDGGDAAAAALAVARQVDLQRRKVRHGQQRGG